MKKYFVRDYEFIDRLIVGNEIRGPLLATKGRRFLKTEVCNLGYCVYQEVCSRQRLVFMEKDGNSNYISECLRTRIGGIGTYIIADADYYGDWVFTLGIDCRGIDPFIVDRPVGPNAPPTAIFTNLADFLPILDYEKYNLMGVSVDNGSTFLLGKFIRAVNCTKEFCFRNKACGWDVCLVLQINKGFKIVCPLNFYRTRGLLKTEVIIIKNQSWLDSAYSLCHFNNQKILNECKNSPTIKLIKELII